MTVPTGISIIDIAARPRTPVRDGYVQTILSARDNGTRVEVSIGGVTPGVTHTVGRSDRTQVVYVLDGSDVRVTHMARHGPTEHVAQRHCGVYLEPGENAALTVARGPLTLLAVSVPKYTGRPARVEAPTGYVFDESRLRTFVDEHRLRERTFWVNTETGLSESWDLQLGRMRYTPNGYSPRHVHHASASSSVTPEHFYLIRQGEGEVRHDNGALPVRADHLVLIPAGEWHQLAASVTGFDYFEFQAPFDFETTMDDPRGKHWYIKGTDDGTGRPKPWVQS
jgi:mannose-6-phosphate isomerase-like protein (cupin superfamily)